ncbi:MAG: undecaprenyldiphospho-muramoylpentapeptide beta-N-acetylglucosaminyltransferase [Saprospiraceae bacterium]
MTTQKLKVMIAGGGTGGHVYPAIAIADAIKKQVPQAEILFVGAEGKLEMEKVPMAGYRIEGLPVVGFQRKLTWKNLLFPFKLMASMIKARQIAKAFQPDVAVGVGGYASGPAVRAAAGMGVPAVLQEQNAFPGVTNKMLAASAKKICVAYDGMERYFPKEKLVLTGNPVRTAFFEGLKEKRAEALAHFGLDAQKQTVFIFGGSLGAKTLNESMMEGAGLIGKNSQVQWIWQTGRFYEATALQSETAKLPNVKAQAFIDRMDLAYAAADVIIGRAGALSIAELCLVGKPAVLVPSPNVAEDHQTKNALALVEKNAAKMVSDAAAREELLNTVFDLLGNESERQQLAANIAKLAKPRAAEEIAEVVLSLAKAQAQA